MTLKKTINRYSKALIGFWKDSLAEILFLLLLLGVLYVFHRLPYINIFVPLSYLLTGWWIVALRILHLDSRYTTAISIFVLGGVALCLAIGWNDLGAVMAEIGYYGFILTIVQYRYEGKPKPTF